jgi:hypothetical protein
MKTILVTTLAIFATGVGVRSEEPVMMTLAPAEIVTDGVHLSNRFFERSQSWDDRISRVVGILNAEKRRGTKPLVDVMNRAISRIDIRDKDVLNFTEDQIVGKPHNFDVGIKFSDRLTLYYDDGLAFNLPDKWRLTFPNIKKKGFTLDHPW